MTCMSGPPWMPGKPGESIFLANSSLHSEMPPRGPRRVLCVVVVTKSACGHRARMHAGGDEAGDVRHVDEQIGADRRAISPMRSKSMMRG